MPTVSNPSVLAAVYNATLSLARAGELPTQLIPAGHPLFRSVSLRILPKPSSGNTVSRQKAQEALKPQDAQPGLPEKQAKSRDGNRFTGLSYDASIPAAAGLYCVLQQQALMNEAIYYGRKKEDVMALVKSGVTLREAALAFKCVAKLIPMDRFLVADLSPHNQGAKAFFGRLETQVSDVLAKTQFRSTVSFWDRLTDSDDCSVARGVGLALAQVNYLDGLVVQTVRSSGRSPDEKGDNLILFGRYNTPISGLYVDQVLYFDVRGGMERFAVTFP